jgi:chromosome segregation ATPase
LTALKAERHELATRLSARDAELQQLQADLERARATEQSLREAAAAAERNLTVAQERARGFEMDRARLANDLSRLHVELRTAQDQLKLTKTDSDVGRTSAQSMERDLEQALDQLLSVEQQRAELASDLEATKAGLDRAKQHVSVLQSRREQMREEIARLRVQLGLAPDAVA